MVDLLKYCAILIIPLCYVLLSSRFPALRLSGLLKRPSTRPEQTPAEKEPKKQLKTVMQPPQTNLAPPKDESFTTEQLRQFDGSDPTRPIYVAIKGLWPYCLVYSSNNSVLKGTVFDVTAKAEVYGAGKSYNVFAGKDGSKGLGMSSLKGDDAVADYSGLDEKDMKVLNDWYSFFE